MITRRRALLFIVSAVALAPAPGAAQTFEGVVSARLHADGGRGPSDVQYLLREGVLRMEMAARGDARSVVIVDPVTRSSYLLLPARMHVTMPIGTGSGGGQRGAEVVWTGRKERIAGYECEHWLIKDTAGDLDACVTTGLGAFSMGSMGGETSWSGTLRDARGFPLKISRAGGSPIMEVTKIEPRRLDPALFAPPADYKRMEMPAGTPPRPSRP